MARGPVLDGHCRLRLREEGKQNCANGNPQEHPGETDDLGPKDPERLERLRGDLEAAVTLAGRDAYEPRTTSLDEQEIERLKALGYVGDD